MPRRTSARQRAILRAYLRGEVDGKGMMTMRRASRLLRVDNSTFYIRVAQFAKEQIGKGLLIFNELA